jgi:dihydrodipicolinate reductase
MIRVGVYGGTGRVGKLLLEDFKNGRELDIKFCICTKLIGFFH